MLEKVLLRKLHLQMTRCHYIDYNNLCISDIFVSENCVKTVISQLYNSAPGHDGRSSTIYNEAID